jgi:hypothetical protein
VDDDRLSFDRAQRDAKNRLVVISTLDSFPAAAALERIALFP